MGTVEDYLRLYEVTSVAMRLADPEAWVGGPSVGSFHHRKNLYDEEWNLVGESDRPLLFDLIDHVAATPAPELDLDHLPLAFFLVGVIRVVNKACKLAAFPVKPIQAKFCTHP